MLLAQTFRVLVLAAVVHSEDEGLQDESHDNSHHHLAGQTRGLEREGDVREQSRSDVGAASSPGRGSWTLARCRTWGLLWPRTYHGHDVEGHEVEAAPV